MHPRRIDYSRCHSIRTGSLPQRELWPRFDLLSFVFCSIQIDCMPILALELPKIPVEVFYCTCSFAGVRALVYDSSYSACFIKPEPMMAKLAYIFLLLAFDSITFLATAYYTATQYQFVARHGIPRLSKLFTSIVEGAVMYFGVLVVCHAVLVAGVLTWRVRFPRTADGPAL